MNDTAIKNFCVWARGNLIEEVEKRCVRYGVLEEGSPAADAQVVDGRVLTEQERSQRAGLLRLAEADGWDALVERAAYTWFNRLVAIRFMEANDRLPSHVRVLSAPDGSFRPQALGEAMDLPLSALDADEVARLVQEGDDEALFRRVFLAQCDELADCMPQVFEHIGSAMELLLPDGLLRQGSVMERLVDEIPEDDWREGVQIVGWMYQYYMTDERARLQDAKVGRGEIGPATQVYTPDWIVRYMVQNSIGRLWMLNHPDSPLESVMPYYVNSGETEFLHLDSPEQLTVMDPACGSGHILAYAFDLLSQIYFEAGYSKRDTARLIIEKNLFGLEIDDRSTALAAFSLTMKACEVDSRFLKWGIAPNIRTLTRVDLSDEDLSSCPNLAKRTRLVDGLRNLDLCGSLFSPTPDEIDAIGKDIAENNNPSNLFAASLKARLANAYEMCDILARKWAVLIANPPYRNSGKMDKWLNGWIKKSYPKEKSDLFAAFIWRLANSRLPGGLMAIAASNSWMFISSYEKARTQLLSTMDIATLVQLSVHGFEGIAAQVFVFACVEKQQRGYRGGYIRLNDFDHHSLQEPKTLEAIADPDACPWFYRADAENFKSIPGTPIAYWASDAVRRSFSDGDSLGGIGRTTKGLITGDNNKFLRCWWECSLGQFSSSSKDIRDLNQGIRWFACTKGGPFRKWAGNAEWAIDWSFNGERVKKDAKAYGHHCQDYADELKFYEAVTWSAISSDRASFRYTEGTLSEHAGMCDFFPSSKTIYALAFLNSSVAMRCFSFLSPTLNFNAGDIDSLPLIFSSPRSPQINETANDCIGISTADWDSHETSWGFKRHPLV